MCSTSSLLFLISSNGYMRYANQILTGRAGKEPHAPYPTIRPWRLTVFAIFNPAQGPRVKSASRTAMVRRMTYHGLAPRRVSLVTLVDLANIDKTHKELGIELALHMIDTWEISPDSLPIDPTIRPTGGGYTAYYNVRGWLMRNRRPILVFWAWYDWHMNVFIIMGSLRTIGVPMLRDTILRKR